MPCSRRNRSRRSSGESWRKGRASRANSALAACQRFRASIRVLSGSSSVPIGPAEEVTRIRVAGPERIVSGTSTNESPILWNLLNDEPGALSSPWPLLILPPWLGLVEDRFLRRGMVDRGGPPGHEERGSQTPRGLRSPIQEDRETAHGGSAAAHGRGATAGRHSATVGGHRAMARAVPARMRSNRAQTHGAACRRATPARRRTRTLRRRATAVHVGAGAARRCTVAACSRARTACNRAASRAAAQLPNAGALCLCNGARCLCAGAREPRAGLGGENPAARPPRGRGRSLGAG